MAVLLADCLPPAGGRADPSTITFAHKTSLLHWEIDAGDLLLPDYEGTVIYNFAPGNK
jgi:hypothetical protein